MTSSAIADEGQIEINQARALQGGITPGDAPGFPVTISQPGSYRLTGNLLVKGATAPNTDGIQIEADDVLLDLAGFVLRCERPGLPLPLACPGAGGVGDGIDVAGVRHVRIENGAVVDFARHGVFVATGSEAYRLADLRISGHGSVGINSYARGTVEKSLLTGNAGYGLGSWSGSDVTVLDSLTAGNGSGGVTRSTGDLALSRSVFVDGLNNVTSADYLGCIRVGAVTSCP
jgi:hypothetical protein